MAAIVALPFAAAVCAAAYLSHVPAFRASALLQLSATENSLVFDANRQPLSDFEIFQGTQNELVRSRLVMTAALRDPALSNSSVLIEERPVDWLLDNVRVSTPEKTEIMTVSVTASRDADPVNLVNAAVRAYLVEVVNRERGSPPASLDRH